MPKPKSNKANLAKARHAPRKGARDRSVFGPHSFAPFAAEQQEVSQRLRVGGEKLEPSFGRHIFTPQAPGLMTLKETLLTHMSLCKPALSNRPHTLSGPVIFVAFFW